MRKAVLALFWMGACFVAYELGAVPAAFAVPANMATPLARAPTEIVTVNHRRYWCCGPSYYPYYAGPAYGYDYPPAAYYPPPAVYYPPPVVYYAPPVPRYYDAPAVYGPYEDGYVIRRQYSPYYVGW